MDDVERYEAEALDLTRRTLHEGWRSIRTGATKPFIEGVQVVDVEREGVYPDSCLVVTFCAPARPGITFASRFRLHEPDGSRVDWRYLPLHLKENIEGARGLPPKRECQPDADGRVWY